MKEKSAKAVITLGFFPNRQDENKTHVRALEHLDA